MVQKIKTSLRNWAIAVAVVIAVGMIQDEVVGLLVLLILAVLGGAKLLEAAR